MQRGAWVFRLKDGKEDAYRRAHEQVWPELIEAGHTAGLKKESVFLRGSIVFAYAEAEDLNATIRLLSLADVTRRWNEVMAAYMEDPKGERMDEIYRFDSSELES